MTTPPTTKVTIDFYEHRKDFAQSSWDLPPWGHVVSKGVLPLFVRGGDRLFGIGTAFWVGPKVHFVLTALHNILAALDHEPRLQHLLGAREMPSKIALHDAGLYVLHQDEVTKARGRFTLLPLETVNGAPPGDVVFGYPQFQPNQPRLTPPLSFDPPRIGETVWSLGYTDFEPRDGIPMRALTDPTSFDWGRDYRHRLVVTEGVVRRIFTQRFAAGFVGGPCFAFDAEIAHGQSGGPIMTTDGRIVGINSAGATQFFNEPMSLGSMLFPLLLTGVQFGAEFGDGTNTIRFNGERPLFDLILDEVIGSDGSIAHVAVHETPEGPAVGARTYKADADFIHADFRGLQDGRRPDSIDGPVRRFITRGEAAVQNAGEDADDA